ncbi:MAG: FAD-binding protein [Anaerolineales bacterium]|nr:FAD-binding protein [Anaerolineales bacterium]
MSDPSSKISRRDYLKGTATTLIGAAAISILGGCSPKEVVEESVSDPVEQAAGAAPVEQVEGAAATTITTERIPGYCSSIDWLGKAPVIADKDITETIETDVVVVGGGHSGLLAALGAVDEGAKVAVIETQPWSAFVDINKSGTNMGGWYGEDIGHVNSQWLLDQGYGPFNTGEIAYEFVKRSLGRADPDLIKLYVQNSGLMVDREMEIYRAAEARRKSEDGAVLVNKELHGQDGVTVDFSDMLSYPLAVNHHQHEKDTVYPIVVGDFKTWPCNIQFYGHQGNNIEYFLKYLLYYCQDNGATWYFEHTGVVLVQNDAGDVTGVIAEDVNNPGEYKKFVAKNGVVVACGDFKGNPEMEWALLNEQQELHERNGGTVEDWAYTGTRDGSGQKMMCWAGGVMQAGPRGSMSFGGGPRAPWGSSPVLQLNALGKRFYNEGSIPTAGAICTRAIAGPACYVTDKKLFETLFQNGLDHGSGNYGWAEMYEEFRKQFDAIQPGNPEGTQISGIGVAESLAFMKSTVYCADTLDELADMLGYTGDAKQNLLDSVAHYNELCYSEEGDTDYGKDKNLMIPVDEGPFYGGTGALSGKQSIGLVTLAGVIADSDLHVVRNGDKSMPIKGLYTCGNCLGGRFGLGYVTPMAGCSVGMAQTHGWIAGKNAAKAI